MVKTVLEGIWHEYLINLCVETAPANFNMVTAECSFEAWCFVWSLGGSIHNSTLPAGSALAQTNPEIMKLLEAALTWDFDVIRLEHVTNKRSVVKAELTLFDILNRCGKLPRLKLAWWLWELSQYTAYINISSHLLNHYFPASRDWEQQLLEKILYYKYLHFHKAGKKFNQVIIPHYTSSDLSCLDYAYFSWGYQKNLMCRSAMRQPVSIHSLCMVLLCDIRL